MQELRCPLDEFELLLWAGRGGKVCNITVRGLFPIEGVVAQWCNPLTLQPE